MIKERTLVVVKPDGVQRSLIGEITGRFERVGLKLVGVKMIVPTKEFIETHYTIDPEWRRITGEKTIKSYKEKGQTPPSEDPLEITGIILNHLKNYMITGPVVAMVWEGVHAVKIVRKLVGSTEPLSSDVGTIRGDYVIDSYQLSDKDGRAVRNLMRTDWAHPGLGALTWGGEDLLADMGAMRNRDPNGAYLGPFTLARDLTLLAAIDAGAAAIDAVYTNFRDLAGLQAESELARDLGFTGKMAIHPGQIATINAAFAPSAQQIDWAAKVVDAFSLGEGVARLGGEMLDAPHLRRAKRILERA